MRNLFFRASGPKCGIILFDENESRPRIFKVAPRRFRLRGGGMTSALQAASLRGGSAAELDFVPDRPIPAPVPKLRKARPGGVPWNRVVVGDALAEMRKISAADLFDIAIVDPPYNIGKDFGNNADRRDMPDYLRWTDEIIAEAMRLAKPSAPVYVYGQSEILARVAARRPLEKQRWLVWHYTNKTVPRLNFWQRSHESILCLWKGARPKIRADAVREPYTEHYKNARGKSGARPFAATVPRGGGPFTTRIRTGRCRAMS